MNKPANDPALHLIALNSGSSSLKFGLYAVQPGQVTGLVRGEAQRIGQARSAFQAEDGSGRSLCSETAALPTVQDVVARVAGLLVDLDAPAPQAIGHRVVHGGPALRQHCRIDDAVLQQLQDAVSFAPLHTPATLAVIRSAQALYPGLAQMACFDTVFHANMPAWASVLPLPAGLRARGLRRYGFHGLSCESLVQQLTQAPDNRPPARLLIAHLGNGASVSAVRDGVSIDTSMGLTPSGGLIMGTRSGDLDPGVLVWLAREQGYDAAMLEDLVDHRSGLAGISGLDGDMRALHAAAATNAEAALAIRMFCYAVRKQLAAMWAVLDGVDAIVFTGGIGEHDAAVRAEVCAGLSSLGVQLDEARHRALDNPISSAGSSCKVLVLPSLEDEQIARHTARLFKPAEPAAARRGLAP